MKMPRETFYGYMRGNRKKNVEFLIELAIALDLKPTYFIKNYRPKPKEKVIYKNRLREFRNNRGLTLKGMSEELAGSDIRIDKDVLSKYERSERNPHKETWEKLADYFDVSLEYLQKRDEEQPKK